MKNCKGKLDSGCYIAGVDLGQILTDFLNEYQRCKSARGHASPGNVLDFNSLSPLSCVSASFRRYIGQFFSPWVNPCESAYYLISTWNFFMIKNIFIIKNVTDFRACTGFKLINLNLFCSLCSNIIK